MKNNSVFKKIMIANGLKQFEVKDIFKMGGKPLSSSAIKALSAGAKNKNYIKMSDEELEAFLNGLIVYWRGDLDESALVPRGIENFVIQLMKANNADALAELECLVQDAKDGLGLEHGEEADG